MKIDMTLLEDHQAAKNYWKVLKNKISKEVISRDNYLPPKKNNGDT